MTYVFSKKSENNRRGVDPRLIEISDLAIRITPVDFGIPEYGGIRSALEQRELYNDGKSRCDGYKDRSRHQSGEALDFFAYVNGRASWAEYPLSVVAAAHLQAASMLGHKLRWGGLWKKFEDLCHVEML